MLTANQWKIVGTWLFIDILPCPWSLASRTQRFSIAWHWNFAFAFDFPRQRKAIQRISYLFIAFRSGSIGSLYSYILHLLTTKWNHSSTGCFVVAQRMESTELSLTLSICRALKQAELCGRIHFLTAINS